MKDNQATLLFFLGVLLASRDDIKAHKLTTLYRSGLFGKTQREVLDIEMKDGSKWRLSAKKIK